MLKKSLPMQKCQKELNKCFLSFFLILSVVSRQKTVFSTFFPLLYCLNCVAEKRTNLSLLRRRTYTIILPPKACIVNLKPNPYFCLFFASFPMVSVIVFSFKTSKKTIYATTNTAKVIINSINEFNSFIHLTLPIKSFRVPIDEFIS